MKLITYKPSNFKSPVVIDDEFKQICDDVNEILIKFDFTLIPTSSKRNSTLVKGAIVTPAQMSNHLVGHAIDANLQDNKTGEYFNSKKMGDNIGADKNVIEALVAKGIRWGGNFRKKDQVHLDDGLNLKNPEKWKQLNKLFNEK